MNFITNIVEFVLGKLIMIVNNFSRGSTLFIVHCTTNVIIRYMSHFYDSWHIVAHDASASDESNDKNVKQDTHSLRLIQMKVFINPSWSIKENGVRRAE